MNRQADLEVVQDAIVPARHGMAFEVKKGQVLRIYLVEDTQVGDCVFFNANDYKEMFHVGATWSLNVFRDTGGSKDYKYLYSKPHMKRLSTK